MLQCCVVDKTNSKSFEKLETELQMLQVEEAWIAPPCCAKLFTKKLLSYVLENAWIAVPLVAVLFTNTSLPLNSTTLSLP